MCASGRRDYRYRKKFRVYLDFHVSTLTPYPERRTCVELEASRLHITHVLVDARSRRVLVKSWPRSANETRR